MEELVQELLTHPVVFEGGAPDVFEAGTFHHNCPRYFLWLLYKRMLLSRHQSQEKGSGLIFPYRNTFYVQKIRDLKHVTFSA